MSFLVADKAQLMCSMGLGPSLLTVLPTPDHAANAGPAMSLATISDVKPLANISSFGLCMSLANPIVAAATAAANGVLTPSPCVPATSAPWSPPSRNVTIRGVPAVNQEATCQCTWAGSISVVNPAQFRVSTG